MSNAPTPGGTVEPVRVAIVDGQPVTRLGVRAALVAEPDLEVVGEASRGVDGVRLARVERPDVVVLGMNLDGERDGLQTCRDLAADRHSPAVLVYTVRGSAQDVATYFLAGARGGVHKCHSRATLVDAIRRTAAGEQVWETLDRPEEPRRVTRTTPSGSTLSPREAEVLALKLRRRTNREIASQLHIAVNTVKHHVSSVYRKLGKGEQ